MPVTRTPGTQNAPNTPPTTPDNPGIWGPPYTPPSTPNTISLSLPSSTSDPSISTPISSTTPHRSSTPNPSFSLSLDPLGIPRTSYLTKDYSAKRNNSEEERGDITTFNWSILLHEMNKINNEKEVEIKKVQEINARETGKMKRRRDESDEYTRPPPKWGFRLQELKEELEEELEEELDYS